MFLYDSFITKMVFSKLDTQPNKLTLNFWI